MKPLLKILKATVAYLWVEVFQFDNIIHPSGLL